MKMDLRILSLLVLAFAIGGCERPAAKPTPMPKSQSLYVPGQGAKAQKMVEEMNSYMGPEGDLKRGDELWDKGDKNGAKSAYREAIRRGAAPRKSAAWIRITLRFPELEIQINETDTVEQAEWEVDKRIVRSCAWAPEVPEDPAILKARLEALDKTIAEEPTGQNHYARGWARFRMRDFEGAIKDFDDAAKRERKLADAAQLARGRARIKLRQYAEAKADFQFPKDLFGHPDGGMALAWLLATCPDDTVRDGKRATTLANEGSSLYPHPYNLAVLAAAYAEAGNFGFAVEVQELAIKGASGKLTDLVGDLVAFLSPGRLAFIDPLPPQEVAVLKARLKMYQDRKPLRDE